MRILHKENVAIDCLTGHGGFFKAPKVGQQYLANAMNAPVSVMETAGEGGAHGMALLVAYQNQSGRRAKRWKSYLEDKVFASAVAHHPPAGSGKGRCGICGLSARNLKKRSKAERAAVEGA